MLTRASSEPAQRDYASRKTETQSPIAHTLSRGGPLGTLLPCVSLDVKEAGVVEVVRLDYVMIIDIDSDV